MLKKTMMICLYLVLGYQAKASTVRSIASEPASVKTMKNICTVQAGDVGKLKFRGQTYEQAFSRVTQECFERRTDLYIKSRNQQPPQERQIQFAESCANSVQCI